jgi:WD40 repeat protein
MRIKGVGLGTFYHFAGPMLLLLAVTACGATGAGVGTRAETGRLNLITPPGESQADPHWLPDGERLIVHSRRGWIVVSANDGTMLAQLSDSGSSIYILSVAADGSRALLASRLDDHPNGFQDLYIVGLDGAGRIDLSVSDRVWEAVLSPDGTRLAYTTLCGLYFLGGDRYEELLGLYQTEPAHPQVRSPVQDLAWSPDGQSLAYTTPGELRVVDVGTGDISDLYQFPEPLPVSEVTGQVERSVFSPVWSPDSQKIFFGTRNGGFVYDLSRQALLELPAGFGRTSWSRDSLTLYSNHCPGAASITLTDPSVSKIPVNIPEQDYTSGCDWSPDGDSVLVRRVTSREGNIVSADFYLFAVDQQELIRLTSGSDVKDQASWSPDGTRIAFIGYYVWGPTSAVYILEVP